MWLEQHLLAVTPWPKLPPGIISRPYPGVFPHGHHCRGLLWSPRKILKNAHQRFDDSWVPFLPPSTHSTDPILPVECQPLEEAPPSRRQCLSFSGNFRRSPCAPATGRRGGASPQRQAWLESPSGRQNESEEIRSVTQSCLTLRNGSMPGLPACSLCSIHATLALFQVPEQTWSAGVQLPQPGNQPEGVSSVSGR